MKQVVNGKHEQRGEVMQQLINMYEQRGDVLFNKVSARFCRVKDIISYTKEQIETLIDGIDNIEKDALGKVQQVIMDNHPHHGLSADVNKKIQDMEKNKINIFQSKQKNSIGSKQIQIQCEEIIQDLADITLDVIDRKINTFIELLTSNIDQVNAKIDQLLKQTSKRNIFKTKVDFALKKINNRDVIWVDYEGISLTQNDKLLFEKSSRTQ